MWGIVITVLKQYWKPLTIFVLISAAFFGGWKSNTVYIGYKDGLEQRIEKKVSDGLDKIEREHAQNYLDTKKLLQSQKTEVIEKEIPYIVEKEVYKNVCLDQSGVDVLMKLREKSRITRGVK